MVVAIASAVIGPVFIHHVASRTLLGIKRAAEQRAALAAPPGRR